MNEPRAQSATDAHSSIPSHQSATPSLQRGVPAIPDHELLQVIGRGSYGEVWLARNVFGEYRAVKIVYRSTFEHERPFEREFSGIKKFEPVSRSHEGLMDLLQVGRNDLEGYFYYVMEVADDANAERPPARAADTLSRQTGDGRNKGNPQSYAPHTLRSELTRRSRLSLDECIQLGLSLTGALGYLHAQGLVHRDIKPSNIIFVGGVPKLADVGLVAGVGEARSYVGTEGFIPPEGPGSPQADLYSLGIVLYVISTGQRQEDFPAPLPDLAAQPDHARWLEFNAIIHKACCAGIRERYQSAEEMHDELALLQRGQSVKRKRAIERRWAFVKKGALVVGSAALLVAGWRITTELLPPAREAQREISGHDQQEAERLYQHARSLSGDHTKENFFHRVQLLNQAIGKNPNHARAYAVLASAYWEGNEWYLPPKQAMSEVKKNALKAVELNSKSAEGHVWLGMAKMFSDHDWTGAEQEFKRAIELDAKSPAARNGYARLLQNQGRLPEARIQQTLAHELTPNSLYMLCDLNYQFFAERLYDRAIENSQKVLVKDANYFRAHVDLSVAHLGNGDYQKAVEEIQICQRLDDGADLTARLGYTYARMGRAEDARASLAKLEALGRSHYVTPLFHAQILAGLGDNAKALDYLEKAYDDRSTGLGRIKIDPTWDSLRSDPRFIALLRKLGLEK